MVHAMQMEKGMHKIWGRCLDYNLVLFEILKALEFIEGVNIKSRREG